MAKLGDIPQGCAWGFGILLVMVTGVIMFTFVFLPLQILIGIARLFGLDKRLNRPRPRNRRD